MIVLERFCHFIAVVAYVVNCNVVLGYILVHTGAEGLESIPPGQVKDEALIKIENVHPCTIYISCTQCYSTCPIFPC